jgi:hypothetical protein
MVVDLFPPPTSVREIREFDGSAEKLTDFFPSIKRHLAAYNLPLKTGGIVRGDVDEKWTFAGYAMSTQLYKINYNYGQCFCILLAERFTNSACERWITRQNAANRPEYRRLEAQLLEGGEDWFLSA